MGLGDITYSCNVISPSDTGGVMKIISNDRVVRDTRKNRRRSHRLIKYVNSRFFDGRSRWFRRNVK